MYDYNVYSLWLVIPTVVGLFLLYIVSFALYCCVGDSIIGVVKFLLGDIIEERDVNGSKNYYIRGQPLKGSFRNVIISNTFQLTACALMTFWYVFLVDVTYGCVSHLDCFLFPVGVSTAVAGNMTPIMNCSEYEILPDNMTVLCFTFVFDYPQAIGAAGGVFAFAVLGIRAMIGILMWLQNRNSDGCGICLMLVLTTMYFIGTITVYLLGTLVPLFRPLVIGPPKQIQFFVYSITFLTGFIMVPSAYLFQSH